MCVELFIISIARGNGWAIALLHFRVSALAGQLDRDIRGVKDLVKQCDRDTLQ